MYPEEAQHPVMAISILQSWMVLYTSIAWKHTENRRHDAYARVCAGLVGLSHTELGKGGEARSGGPGDGLGVFDDHDDELDNAVYGGDGGMRAAGTLNV